MKYEVVTVKSQLGRFWWRHPIHSLRVKWFFWREKRRWKRLPPEMREALYQYRKDVDRAFLFGE